MHAYAYMRMHAPMERIYTRAGGGQRRGAVAVGHRSPLLGPRRIRKPELATILYTYVNKYCRYAGRMGV